MYALYHMESVKSIQLSKCGSYWFVACPLACINYIIGGAYMSIGVAYIFNLCLLCIVYNSV